MDYGIENSVAMQQRESLLKMVISPPFALDIKVISENTKMVAVIRIHNQSARSHDRAR